MTKRLFFIILSAFATVSVQAGQECISGRITDARTREPLAFVNIVYNASGQGIVSDIDGRFSIPAPAGIEFLHFSYLGYRTRIIPASEIRPGARLEVKLERTTYPIGEVQVSPGPNPAHRIIRLACHNRKLNNPEQRRSFSYTAYNKMFFTKTGSSGPAPDREADPIKDKSEGDSGEPGAWLEDHHLFLMEFISKREFLYSDRNRETVTASRVSGLKDPSFTLLASQIQSFSFYEDQFTILDREYLNPISRGSTRKYLFILEDTLYNQRMDTLFVISYRPLRNRNFDGLKGILHINSRGYAVQNVIAQAAESRGPVRIRIQQQYEYIDDRQWFPVRLNTEIFLDPAGLQAGNTPVSLVGIGKSYLYDIDLNPDLDKRNFSPVVLNVREDAHKKQKGYWDQYRFTPLSRKDTNTYAFLDSISEEARLERNLYILETMATGHIPVKFLNIDYRNIIQWNRYEGFRLGLSAETNRKLSPWFSLGGKAAYGTRDRYLKYGGHLRLNLNRRADAFLGLRYNHDVFESAGIEFIEKPPFTSSEFFRTFLIARKDIIEEKEVSLQARVIRYMKIRGYLNRNSIMVSGDYRYLVERDNEILERDRFEMMTAGIQLRYAFKEKFIETTRGNLISLGTDYPVIQANVRFGIPVMGGELEFSRMETRIQKQFLSRSLGETRLTLTCGWVDRDVPYPLLYAGKGSYGKFTIESENSFATMRMNEFVAGRFAGIHLRQDFGSRFFRQESFRPEIVLATSAGYGKLKSTENHINLPGSSYEKGYFESGILFNNLLRQGFIGYGLGAFYRWGPYSLPGTIDNFAFKFTVRFNI